MTHSTPHLEFLRMPDSKLCGASCREAGPAWVPDGDHEGRQGGPREGRWLLGSFQQTLQPTGLSTLQGVGAGGREKGQHLPDPHITPQRAQVLGTREGETLQQGSRASLSSLHLAGPPELPAQRAHGQRQGLSFLPLSAAAAASPGRDRHIPGRDRHIG